MGRFGGLNLGLNWVGFGAEMRADMYVWVLKWGPKEIGYSSH